MKQNIGPLCIIYNYLMFINLTIHHVLLQYAG